MTTATKPASKNSRATDRALAMISPTVTAYRAAKKTGISLSTVYRALKRKREGK